MRWTRGSEGAVAMLTATLVLMLVGITVGFESFNGKGFVARIVIYPIEVWDDVNHLVNWFLLMWGVGLLVFATPGSVRSRPVLAVFTVGALGALLAVGWGGRRVVRLPPGLGRGRRPLPGHDRRPGPGDERGFRRRIARPVVAAPRGGVLAA